MRYFIWAVVFSAFGATLALILYDFSYFVYENSFNIFELLYFVLTAAIAIFVTGRLDEAIQRKRSQKDIIIHKIEEVDAEIKNLYGLFVFNGETNKYSSNNTALLSKIKSIALWSKRYENSVKHNYPTLESSFVKINTRKLVSICTKVPRTGETQDIVCENNFWLYSEDKYSQIQREIENIRSICFDNILLLNSV